MFRLALQLKLSSRKKSIVLKTHFLQHALPLKKALSLEAAQPYSEHVLQLTMLKMDLMEMKLQALAW